MYKAKSPFPYCAHLKMIDIHETYHGTVWKEQGCKPRRCLQQALVEHLKRKRRLLKQPRKSHYKNYETKSHLVLPTYESVHDCSTQ